MSRFQEKLKNADLHGREDEIDPENEKPGFICPECGEWALKEDRKYSKVADDWFCTLRCLQEAEWNIQWENDHGTV